jgi:hypothetical protein
MATCVFCACVCRCARVLVHVCLSVTCSCSCALYLLKLKLKLKLIYDSLGVRCPSGTHDKFFFLLEIFFRQLRVCYFVAPSLTRGRVCNLLVQFLLGLVRAVTLGSKSRRTHGHILLSHLKFPQHRGPGSRIYIPQEQGGPVISPDTGFHFCRLLRLAGQRWRYSNPPPHGVVILVVVVVGATTENKEFLYSFCMLPS